MPRIWNDTVKEHREAVRDAILDATATLAQRHGLSGVSMARIAKQTEIGRSTLYKYYPRIDAILADWHQREIDHHLEHIRAIVEGTGNAAEALRQALEAYGLNLQRGYGVADIATLHQADHVQSARRHLVQLVAHVIEEGARTAAFRDDVSPNELAEYCVHALAASRELSSKVAVRRLVNLTLDALQAPMMRKV
jgi:AcrR family transcriptional regulator